jgi:diguanylate cyclase (GGDEF)-like protein
VAVLFLDMDRFKVINDTLGHEVGDSLLKGMAARLGECVREGDTVARLGGDEFAVVLNDIASLEDVTQVARKILEAINRPFHVAGRELFATTSVGISRFPDDGSDGLTLLKKADVAMYRAKASGKNNYRFYTEEDENKSIRRLSMETCLRRALHRNEFSLHYQPQLHLREHRIIGLEALLRWQNPEHPDASPAQFIPLLEETGMILPVGEWVLYNACRQAVEYQRAGGDPLRVSVNISIAQFRQDNFAGHVGAILRDTGLDPTLLELEITEGVLIDNIQEGGKTLNRIHELGVTLAIDDFGTGYSSMNYLRRLPFDVLKIDRSFVQDATRSRDDAAIVTAIITLAHTMGLEVVAEGVETEDQLDFLVNLGCDMIQGYLCSPPIPADNLQRLHECELNSRFRQGRHS